MLDKIQFQTNVPQELALKFVEGKLMPSNFGDPQYMYSTTDDRVFFVHEKVAQKIHGLRLQPGERIDICKAEVQGSNGRRFIEWQIARVDSPAQPPEEQPAAQSGPGQRAAQKFWAGKEAGEQPDGTFRVPAAAGVRAPAPAATAAFQPPAHNNNNGNGSKPASSAPNGTNGNGHSTPLEAALRGSILVAQTNLLIDAYAACLKHASEAHGNLINAEAVRSIMLSAFINVSKGGANVA